MRSLISIGFVMSLVIAAPFAASAQDAAGQEPAKVAVAQSKPAPPPPPPPPPAPTRMVNIQVEITISDQLGAGPATKKTVSLITSDGSVGRIRSSADGFDPGLGRVSQVSLNVDALPRLIQTELIQLNLTIEYRPLKAVVEGKSDGISPTQLNQSLTVIMTSGKPMVVSQAADPVNDRKIVVEAKATILK